jgi:hypothetical protein
VLIFTYWATFWVTFSTTHPVTLIGGTDKPCCTALGKFFMNNYVKFCWLQVPLIQNNVGPRGYNKILKAVAARRQCYIKSAAIKSLINFFVLYIKTDFHSSTPHRYFVLRYEIVYRGRNCFVYLHLPKEQGCKIFLETVYQNGGKMYQIAST